MLSGNPMPPKRKVIEDGSSVDGSSGLSSPLSQRDLNLGAEEQNPTAANKRRIVEGGPIAGKTVRASRGATVKKEIKKEDEDEEGESEVKEDLKTAPKKRSRKKAAVKEEATEVDGDNTATIANPAKKKRKTKEEKEAEAMPLAARTIGHKLFIGAHVSSAGGQYAFWYTAV